MADEIIIETVSTEVIEVGVPGPQGASGQGVPVGGTTGQVLRKASGTNYDTEWATGGAGGGVSSWNDLEDKPATFPPSAHAHTISEVTNLQTSLDGKAATSHSHSISDVTSLQTSLDGKAATSHTHSSSAITDFNAAASAAAPVQSVAGRTGAVTLAVADVSGAVSTSDSRLSDERPDNTFRIVGSSDATKKVAFEVDGIGTGTVRTLSVADASGTLGWLQSVSSITVSSTHQLTAARNQRVLVSDTASAGSGVAIFYPTSGNAEGDRLEVVYASRLNSNSLGVTIRAGLYDYTGSQSIGLGYQRTFIYVAGSWTAGAVEQHTHPDPDPTFASSAFRVTEPSGLATNQLAFSLANITAGATRTLTVPNASGTLALQGAITSSGLTQATARILGRTTASAGAVEEISIGTGLSLSAGQLSATASGGATTQTDVYSSNGTWTKPAGAKMVEFVVVGGGGGGGAGRRGATSTTRGGGGGGAAGAACVGVANASNFGSTETITVGAGGNGGANSADDTNGQNGTQGGSSSIGTIITALGGNGGAGGTSSAGGNGGAGQNGALIYYGTTGNAPAGGNAGVGGSAVSPFPSSGGGGGTLSNTNVSGNGGSSGAVGSGQIGVYQATSNGINTVNGVAAKFTWWGTGGAGVRADTNNLMQKAGDGATGGGGGGGAGCTNSTGGVSTGGSGGSGIVVITTYF